MTLRTKPISGAAVSLQYMEELRILMDQMDRIRRVITILAVMAMNAKGK